MLYKSLVVGRHLCQWCDPAVASTCRLLPTQATLPYRGSSLNCFVHSSSGKAFFLLVRPYYRPLLPPGSVGLQHSRTRSHAIARRHRHFVGRLVTASLLLSGAIRQDRAVIITIPFIFSADSACLLDLHSLVVCSCLPFLLIYPRFFVAGKIDPRPLISLPRQDTGFKW